MNFATKEHKLFILVKLSALVPIAIGIVARFFFRD